MIVYIYYCVDEVFELVYRKVREVLEERKRKVWEFWEGKGILFVEDEGGEFIFLF